MAARAPSFFSTVWWQEIHWAMCTHSYFYPNKDHVCCFTIPNQNVKFCSLAKCCEMRNCGYASPPSLFHDYINFLPPRGDIVQSLQIDCPLFYTECVSRKVEHRMQRTVSLWCVCTREMLKKHFIQNWLSRECSLYILTIVF